VRAVYCSCPADRCKGGHLPPEMISKSPPSHHPTLLTPAERARKVAELRQVLSGSAPTFQAWLDAERRERP
jgi:hypothetical protein